MSKFSKLKGEDFQHDILGVLDDWQEWNLGHRDRRPRFSLEDALGEIQEAYEESRIDENMKDILTEKFEDYIGPENLR